MFGLIRYFSIASAVALIAVTFALVYLYRDNATEHLVVSAEGQNITLARSFANILWPRFSDYVMTVAETDGDRLRARPETAEIDKAVRALTAGLPVLKVKIYNLDGRTIYSSAPSQIGADKSNNPGFMKSARAGKPASKFSFRKNFSAFSGPLMNRDLVESYLPIWGDDDAVEGVFELYTDVTPLVAMIDRRTERLTGGLLITFAVLYAILFVIVRRADQILKRQYSEQLEYQEQIAEKNTSLEHQSDERKRAEEAFSRKSALLEMTFESMSQGIVVYDADFRLTAFNQHYADLYRYPPGFLRLGMPFEDIARFKAKRGDYGPGDAEELARSRVLRKKRGEQVREQRTIGNGRIYTLVWDPIPGGGSVTTHTDVTELRKAEREIAEKSALLGTTFESMSQGIRVLDSDLRLVAFNQRMVDLWEYPPGFLRLGMPYEEISRFNAERSVYGPIDVDEHVRKRMLEKRRGNFIRRERKLPNGLVVAVNHEPMPDGGTVTTYTDVTEQETAKTEMLQAKEQAELANRTKSEFLANMSHELRTPLNAILGFSELMGKATLGPLGNPKYEEYTKDINDSGRHLLALIQDILDLSKIEAGKLELDEEDMDVAMTIRSCMVLVKERARNGGVKLKTDIPDGLPALHADERKLKQILVNLLSNAVRFSPAGGEVTLKAWSCPDSGYVFQVIDTGIGIALADIPTALSPFGQVDSQLDRKYEGTGLGLPLTKSLAEMHGGSLNLQSEVGVGTTVTVRFPKERIVYMPEIEATGYPAATDGELDIRLAIKER